jgi:Tol biopolymer transport system component
MQTRSALLRRLILTLALGTLVVLTLSPAGHSSTFPGANGKVAFTSDEGTEGNYEVTVVNADGSGRTNLTNDPSDDVEPCWSADGSRIVFTSDRDGIEQIYVMNADGSDQTRLTDIDASDRAPCFSPDGTKIAFVRYLAQSNSEIFVMDADGSNQTRLTFNDGADHVPTWSPDGSRIAWNRQDDAGNGNYDIFTMKPDGSDVLNLTQSSDVNDFAPCYSPDGTKLAFESDSDIWVMGADGSDPHALTSDGNTVSDYDPCFSPDGNKIVFIKAQASYDLYVMNADGSDPTPLTEGERTDTDPNWQPVRPAVPIDHVVDDIVEVTPVLTG